MTYKKLIAMFSLSFVLMLITAYSTVYAFDHVYFSFNKFYMVILMTGAMGIVNVVTMYSMYKEKKTLIIVATISIITVLVSFIFIKTQAFIGDRLFLQSMIPHHSAAILACEESDINDPEIIELCEGIVEVQREEIEIMKKLLKK